MAITEGQTVFNIANYNSLSVRPYVPLRGIVGTVADSAAPIEWENGHQTTATPLGALAAVLDAPANIPNLVPGNIFRYASGAQEMQGILADAFIAEEDDGNQRGFVILNLIGRGGATGAYALIEIAPNFSNFGATLIPQAGANFPRT